MTSIYNYPQPYQQVDGSRHYGHHHHTHSNGYYQPAPAPVAAPTNGYYQGQYIQQNVAAPVYQQQQTAAAPILQQQMYAPPPMMAAPAANPYVRGNAYGAYNNNNTNGYYQVPQQQQAPAIQQQAQQQQQQQQQQQGEQAVTGGVSSILDYDLTIMSKFSTYLAFRLFARGDTENDKFITSLKSVLSATRLPLSSLILANYYMLQKFELDPAAFSNSSDDVIYQNVVLSLVLANKANDDNTFTNKSWSDATGLNVKLINVLEVNWLDTIDWKLHDVAMERYNELMIQFNKYVENHNSPQLNYTRHASREPVSPILPSSSSSPIRDHSPSRFNSYSSSNNNNWYGDYSTSVNPTTPTPYNSYEPRYKSYATPSYHHHHKSYSYNEPEYCLRTGSYQKMMYCSCHYCSTPPRTVDWSYNVAAAC